MHDWIVSFVESWGYAGIALLMFLENVFPPLPSELIMPLGGFVSARGELSFVGVCLAGAVGSVLGQLPLYYLGKTIGRQRLRRWVKRHRWLLIDEDDLDRADRLFERHGGITLLFARFVPGVRSLISIPAGVHGMNLGIFLLYSTLGMGTWAGALAGAGHLLGNNYELVEKWLGPVTYVVIGALLGGLLFRAWRRHRRA